MAEYIEREALLNEIEIHGGTNLNVRIPYYQWIIDDIRHAPPVDVVEVKHGYWHRKHIGNGWDDWDALTCSECKKYYEKPNFPTNYCPNCGAKMDLKEGSDDGT